MRYHRRPDWYLPETAATPEAVYLDRRRLMGGLIGAGVIAALPRGARAQAGQAPFAPTPARNPAYADPGRPVTDEALNASYNNFYEFGGSKDIAEAAEALQPAPWALTIDGMVEKPITIDVADLIARMPVEERVYRHRCVEAWSMTVPWIGFPLSALVALAAPLSGAKYVRFETFLDPEIAPGQASGWYPWPYVEGLSIEEAVNELPFMVVGAYGKVLHKSFGAPLRVHVPWKYGFKSGKSISRISFVEEQPLSFWEQLQASEYGFWANVNPDVAHPRWSQASERVLATNERIPTVIYNGYGAQVAGLYAGREDGRTIWF